MADYTPDVLSRPSLKKSLLHSPAEGGTNRCGNSLLFRSSLLQTVPPVPEAKTASPDHAVSSDRTPHASVTRSGLGVLQPFSPTAINNSTFQPDNVAQSPPSLSSSDRTQLSDCKTPSCLKLNVEGQSSTTRRFVETCPGCFRTLELTVDQSVCELLGKSPTGTVPELPNLSPKSRYLTIKPYTPNSVSPNGSFVGLAATSPGNSIWRPGSATGLGVGTPSPSRAGTLSTPKTLTHPSAGWNGIFRCHCGSVVRDFLREPMSQSPAKSHQSNSDSVRTPRGDSGPLALGSAHRLGLLLAASASSSPSKDPLHERGAAVDNVITPVGLRGGHLSGRQPSASRRPVEEFLFEMEE
jgi:hypothetical protein